MSRRIELRMDEVLLAGKWVEVGDKVVADDVCVRIQSLVASGLTCLGADASGWEQLFRDSRDGRLWELTYPQGELHGGGPPCLTCIGQDEARAKYGECAE